MHIHTYINANIYKYLLKKHFPQTYPWILHNLKKVFEVCVCLWNIFLVLSTERHRRFPKRLKQYGIRITNSIKSFVCEPHSTICNQKTLLRHFVVNLKRMFSTLFVISTAIKLILYYYECCLFEMVMIKKCNIFQQIFLSS